MSAVVTAALDAALRLSEDERLELIEAIMSATVTPDRAFDPAWLDELHRRSADYDNGGVQATSWDVVRQRVRDRVAGNG